MTTIIDQLEAPVRVNCNPGYEWTPAVGFDEVDSALGNYFIEEQRPREQAREPGLPSFQNDLRQKTFRLDEPLRPEDQFEGIIGRSASLQEVFGQLQIVAPTDSTVLILGETGTGKELVARAIHHQSPRRDSPFVAVNCGAIPEALLESELFGHVRGAFTGADRDKRGLFEVAGAGTIFLDEIVEMPLSLQPKVLRVLESREILRVGSTSPVRVAARIVAATHRDLKRMVDEGMFRSDLYYRLCVFEIALAPLRLRPEDLGDIARALLERFARSMNRPVPVLGDGVLRALEQHRWPGNVRELANVLERTMILTEGTAIEQHDLPGFLDPAPLPSEDDLKSARASFERSHIRRVLERCGGDKRRAAELLGIDLSSLYRKLEETRRVP